MHHVCSFPVKPRNGKEAECGGPLGDNIFLLLFVSLDLLFIERRLFNQAQSHAVRAGAGKFVCFSDTSTVILRWALSMSIYMIRTADDYY